MHHLKWLLPTLIVAAVAGGGAYYYLTRKPQVVEIPAIGGAQSRQAIAVPGVRYTDVTTPAGIRFLHENGLSGKKLLPETMGGGVAVLDFDRDDKPDLFFVNSCPWPGHPSGNPKAIPALYRNQGDGTFVDVTAKLGLNVTMFGMGVAVGDIDNDTYPDLFVSCVGKHRLFRNEDGKRFTEITDSAGVGGTGEMPKCSWEEFLVWDKPIPFGSSATFLDYDGDARLDLFVCHYVTWSPKIDLTVSSTLRGGERSFVQPKEFDGSQCRLFRNVDGKKFEDVTQTAGIVVTQPDGTGPQAKQRPVAKALGVIACDPDGDGWTDLVVANDTVRNFFYHNLPGPNGTRRFEEVGERAAVAYADEGRPRGGMGIDWAEYLPGKSAVVIGNFANEPNTFLRLTAAKPLAFSDAALAVGLAGPSRQLLKFGTVFFDYDLDGRQDLLTCNGHIEPDIAAIQGGQTFAQPPQLFWNTGDPQRLFEPAAASQTGDDLFKPLVGRGCAYLDYDSDGDLDVVLAANGGPARLLRNEHALGHKSLRLQLRGNGKRTSRTAIGAEVTIQVGGQTYRRTLAGAKGYLSQSESVLTVGLGSASSADQVTVRWPGGESATRVWANLAAGKTHVLAQQ